MFSSLFQHLSSMHQVVMRTCMLLATLPQLSRTLNPRNLLLRWLLNNIRKFIKTTTRTWSQVSRKPQSLFVVSSTWTRLDGSLGCETFKSSTSSSSLAFSNTSAIMKIRRYRFFKSTLTRSIFWARPLYQFVHLMRQVNNKFLFLRQLECWWLSSPSHSFAFEAQRTQIWLQSRQSKSFKETPNVRSKPTFLSNSLSDPVLVNYFVFTWYLRTFLILFSCLRSR